MLILHLLECALKGYDHISDLLLAKYWVITGCKYNDCCGLHSIIIEEENTVYDSRENCNAIIHTATNTLICGSNKTLIPESIVSIQEYAFILINKADNSKISIFNTNGQCVYDGFAHRFLCCQKVCIS